LDKCLDVEKNKAEPHRLRQLIGKAPKEVPQDMIDSTKAHFGEAVKFRSDRQKATDFDKFDGILEPLFEEAIIYMRRHEKQYPWLTQILQDAPADVAHLV
jgi:HJR/Mrr/RecB family endonuclease